MSWWLASLALLSAHLLVDYPLFGERVDREQPASDWARMAGHGLVHALAAYLLLGQVREWTLPLLLGVGHLLIDLGESKVARQGGSRFVAGQSAHLGSIAILLWLVRPSSASLWTQWLGAAYPQMLFFLLGGLTAIWLGGDVVGILVAPFADQLPPREDPAGGGHGDRSDEPRRGFVEGGRMIGYLERALIYLLVLAGQASGVGFLVAAKSIFRFGELRERSNRVEAEYILIGTLASFLWGLAVAILVQRALQP